MFTQLLQMVIYNKVYSNEVCRGTRKYDYLDFGAHQFEKLCYYLGFPIEKRAIRIILENFIYKVYRKGIFLIKEGDNNTNVQYIIDGGVKVFRSANAEIQVLNLIGNGGFVGSINNLFMGLPSNYSFKTCSECKVLEIDGAKIQSLFGAGYQALYKSMIEKIFGLALEHEKEVSQLLRLNNLEKVAAIYSSYDHLFQSFTIKEIASFVNMKPESFSRMRKKILP